jgi:DNA-binding NtrC family response regulator
MLPKVLLVENESRMREVITMQLSDLELEIFQAADGQEALNLLASEEFALVITDLKLPRVHGMEVLQTARSHDSELPVIVITAYGSIENAVDAMRCGASDYVTKPFKAERLRSCVKKALKIYRLTSQVRRLRQEIESRYKFDNIKGVSPQICELLTLAGEVAATDTTVLITGESGTGKELFSRAIHFNSRRAEGPFLPLNCAAIPTGLLESELFGHEADAFTGAKGRKKGKLELAGGGTLFLDEIGDMDLEIQAKLLRVLEMRSYFRVGGSCRIEMDARIISATNKDLRQLVASGKFREDLYYRLNVFPLHIPPLRHHPEDIPLLCDFFIHEFAASQGRRMPTLSQKSRELLRNHPWKGNVRELRNVIERAMILCKSDQITSRHLLLQENTRTIDPSNMEKLSGMLLESGGVRLEELEKSLIEQAMSRAGGNVSRAARMLGLSRPTLRYRLDKYDIAPAGPA